MAKKAAKKSPPKKASKKPKRKAPKIPAGWMSEEAARVFAESSFATAQGMEKEMATDPKKRGYALLAEARDFWLDKHQKSIPAALANSKNKWAIDREFVLEQARNLGRVAAQNAMTDKANSGTAGITVTRAHAKAASVTIATGRVCVAARLGNLGSGPYCPPDPTPDPIPE